MRSERETLPQGSIPDAFDAPQASSSSLPHSGESLTGTRRAHSEVVELPSRWLERLLLLWGDLPVAEGDRAVMAAVVDAVASLVPGHAVAACLVAEGGGAQEIVQASWDEGTLVATDPARLFPASPVERVIEIEPGGSTLHLACEGRGCTEDHTLPTALVERAAHAARRGLELARMQARARDVVAELRRLNAQMVQAEKLASLGQIAAGVVHELNNPLTSIVAYTDYLIRKAERRGPDGDEVDRLQRIAESAGRMLRFTRDLVSYARPSSEVPVAVSVHLAMDRAVAFCEHVIAAAGVTVDRRYTTTYATVRGKPEQLAQVFVNLVTNACHAMAGAGGTLTLITEVEGDAVKVEIQDSGHGIQPTHLGHVFTPFFTTKTSGAGTGLGLAIVKSIVDGHDGAIRVASQPGGGATFTITLPVLKA